MLWFEIYKEISCIKQRTFLLQILNICLKLKLFWWKFFNKSSKKLFNALNVKFMQDHSFETNIIFQLKFHLLCHFCGYYLLKSFWINSNNFDKFESLNHMVDEFSNIFDFLFFWLFYFLALNHFTSILVLYYVKSWFVSL